MRLIKMTGGLGNQMFIYAFYLKMKKLFPHTKIDLSDMMHYHVHHGYEMNRVFALPHVEFCMNLRVRRYWSFCSSRLYWSASRKDWSRSGKAMSGHWFTSKDFTSRNVFLPISKQMSVRLLHLI